MCESFSRRNHSFSLGQLQEGVKGILLPQLTISIQFASGQSLSPFCQYAQPALNREHASLVMTKMALNLELLVLPGDFMVLSCICTYWVILLCRFLPFCQICKSCIYFYVWRRQKRTSKSNCLIQSDCCTLIFPSSAISDFQFYAREISISIAAEFLGTGRYAQMQPGMSIF